ncbi:MAG: LytTR family transcriptional regulator [Spirosomaceae bacterium]|jgi:two-component system LytT family response regulator|nr:LytTR family transcriptional regulator [Spirosomataceae bacterium]
MKTEELLHVGSRKRFDTQEIIMLEAYENYTKVHLVSGQVFISSTTLKKIEARLKDNPNFFRTHKTYLVNLRYVTAMKEKSVEIEHCRNVTLSRRRKGRMQMIFEALNF